MIYTMQDGFQWRIVSQQYAKDNWKNEEIGYLRLREESDSLIDESSLDLLEVEVNGIDDAFGVAMGYIKEASL